METTAKDSKLFGYYDDLFELTEHGWQIASRIWTGQLTVRLIAYPES